ncbi:MAG TPA: hypothetical protein PKK78_15375 [Kouleothrix sp.]|nr:hypothetical protein [Kouleothrix sp.]
MEDLTLDFRNQQGSPIDSIIWLRNGGGKSSILNLFFSLLNPNRHQFLGAKADQGERALEDYVLPNDHAVVIAEWQLDTADQEMPSWYLTGGFYEWHQEQLERLFFSTRVHQPNVTLDCIPLRDDRGQRLTLYGFKQAWQNLGRLYPEADTHETQNQREWRQMLEIVRLDPELFSYQIRMNSREGGADDLFRFKHNDHFVDFFLDMALPAAKSQQIAQNLGKFRLQLRERIEQLLPSLDLIAQLKPKIQPMLRVAAHRHEYRTQVTTAQYDLIHLQQHLQHSLSALSQRLQDIETAKQTSASLVRLAQDQASSQTVRKLSLQRLQLEQQAHRLSDLQQEYERELQDALRKRLIWKAAIPLVRVEKYEEEIHTLEEQLRLLNAELAPDWHDVQVAAQNLAAALLARAEKSRQLQQSQISTADVRRNRAQAARQNANAARLEAGAAEERAKRLARDVAQAHSSRVKLEELGALAMQESPETAIERWQQSVETIVNKQNTLELELNATQVRIDVLQTQLDQSKQQGYEAQRSLRDIQRLINQAREAQAKLVNSAVLGRVLGDVDAQSLNRTSLSALRTHCAEIEQQLRELAANIAEHDVVLEYLRSNHVLPPSRSVQRIVQFLNDRGVTASPGWEHASIAYEHRREEARIFIRQHPDLVQGVLVRDNHFDRARELLQEIQVHNVHLDTAIVVASRSLAFMSTDDEDTVQANTNQKFVIGPTSDAHFDKTSAEVEEQVLELQMQRERMQHEQAESDLRELNQTAEHLEQFIDTYPAEWFSQRQSELYDAEVYQQECDNHTAHFTHQRNEEQDRARQQNKALLTLTHDLQLTNQHIVRLQTHLEHFGTDVQINDMQRQHDAAARQHRDSIVRAEYLEKNAMAFESEADQLDKDATGLEQAASADERDARTVDHLQGLPHPQPGDVHQLRVIHQRLSDVINRKTDGHYLQAELKRARDALSLARNEFESERDQRVTEQDVRTALSHLPERHLAREYNEQAIGRQLALSEMVGRAEIEASTAQRILMEHQRKYSDVHIAPDSPDRVLTVEQLEQQVLLAEEQATAAEKEASVHAEEVARLSKQEVQVQAGKQKFEAFLNRTNNCFHNDELFQDVLVLLSLDTWIAPLDEHLEAHVEELEKSILRARKQRSELLEERLRVWKHYLDCLGESTLDFAKSLRRWNEEDFERHAQTILEQLDMREKNVRDALAESDLHHATLVTELLDIAYRGVQMLQGLARYSSLPETAGMLAGHSFLKIQLATVSTVQEQRERIGSLINDIVEEAEIPNGPKLLQRAVRKLSQPIRVRVLFPDIDTAPRYIPITEMAKQSGGERLTSAVLLYCALSRQRARERGRTHHISSSLLLDNPIGAVSRTKFLELQRETARSMHIQLIYATGVLDMEAIRTMPNVVRLRNERRNAKNQCLVEAIHIGRPEDNIAALSAQ